MKEGSNKVKVICQMPFLQR